MTRLLGQIAICLVAFFFMYSIPHHVAADDREDQLWSSARKGDVSKITTLLDDDVDVNAKTPYSATALSFACSRGHAEVAKLLLDAGADANVNDNFYGATPLSWAGGDNRVEIIWEKTAVKAIPAVKRHLKSTNANPLGEYCLTTPAISDGAMLFRCQRHLIAVEQQLSVDELIALEDQEQAEVEDVLNMF